VNHVPWIAPARLGRSLLIASLLGGASSAAAQSLPRLFDAAWMGFDTGYFGDGFGPRSMAVGDLDGDANLDVVVGNYHFGSPGVSVILAHGLGTFAQPERYALGLNLSVGDVALDDVDADGDLDVLATVPGGNGLDDLLVLWSNDGDGGLGAGPTGTWTACPGPIGLAIADYDGDGFNDVAVACYGYLGQGQTVAILLHNGKVGPDASFGFAELHTTAEGPWELGAGDLDGDGDIDLAVGRGTGSSNGVDILLNDGLSGFKVGETWDVWSGPEPVVSIGDLDGDGDLDVLSSRWDSSSRNYPVVEVRWNAGNATFPTFIEHRLDDFVAPAVDIALGDLDADGNTDIVTANPSGRFALVDADGDGTLDVLTVARSSAALTVHRNPGGGVFLVPPSYPVDPFDKAIAAGDVDGDGDDDIAVASTEIEILLNGGDATFTTDARYPSSVQANDMELADLNGDGFADLIVASTELATAMNRGDGTFEPFQRWGIGSCGNGFIAVADLDGDGDLDIAMSEAPGCSTVPQFHIHLMRNDGTGLLQAMPPILPSLWTSEIAAADLNRDGDLDLVALSPTGLFAYLGNGNLTFRSEVVSATTPGYRIAITDLNGDGQADAAYSIPAGAFGTDLLGVAMGNGDGSFGPETTITASSVLEGLRNGTDLDAADADCDGDPDLILTNYASNDISVFINDGGVLASHVRYGGGTTPFHTVLSDFDKDGAIDIASTMHPTASTCCDVAVTVFRGLCHCELPDITPADQGNVLFAVRRAGDVELSWPGAPAERWRLYRDIEKTRLGRTPLPPDTALAATVDVGAIAWPPPLYFYQLRGLSPCTSTPGP